MSEKTSRSSASTQPRFGQFNRSFVLRVIRNFAFSALLLLLFMLALTYFIFRYQFENEVPEQSRQTAENLASDVTSIMINEGGPVASRAVYPILERNYDRLGYRIAIIPSQATIDSIVQTFGFKPVGVQPDWPDEGNFKEAVVDMPAQDICLQCHVEAEVGDSLGKVVVRNYFSSYFEQWQEDAALSAVAGMVNIIISTTIIFWVMRLRMEPVLRLRAMVSRWAKGTMPLDERIEVKSEDEFGELAHDLNLTLDRIFDILQDLRRTISRQRDIDSDVGEELDRISRLAQQLQREVRESAASNGPERFAALEELETSIERVQMLCDNLKETLRSQELLVKRLE